LTRIGSGTWRADIALLFVAFVWGATFVVVKSALDDVSALLFLALRFSLAGAVLFVIYRRNLSGALDNSAVKLKAGLLAGSLIFVAYVFQTVGLVHTTPSKSAFLTGLCVVLVPVVHSVIFRAAPRVSEAIGVAVAAVGMGLLTLQSGDIRVSFGDLLTLLGAVFFAFHIVAVGHLASKAGFECLSVVQVSTAAFLALSTFWWVEDAHMEWSGNVIFALLITGIFATAVAFSVQAWAQQRTGATRTALIFATEPVFAWLTSYILTGEMLSRRATVGALLILSGILLVELKPLERKKHP